MTFRFGGTMQLAYRSVCTIAGVVALVLIYMVLALFFAIHWLNKSRDFAWGWISDPKTTGLFLLVMMPILIVGLLGQLMEGAAWTVSQPVHFVLYLRRHYRAAKQTSMTSPPTEPATSTASL